LRQEGGKFVPVEAEQHVLGVIRDMRAAGLIRAVVLSELKRAGVRRAKKAIKEVYEPSAITHLHAVGVRLAGACMNDDGFNVEEVFADAIAAECAEVVRLLESRDE
jgi:hypothetical protein